MKNLGSPGITIDEVKAISSSLASTLNFYPVMVPTAPYLFISITCGPRNKLDRNRLLNYFKKIVMSEESTDKEINEWPDFAKNNKLMAGKLPFVQPNQWLAGQKRWMTLTWQSNWELHLHFGFVAHTGSKFSHLELCADTRHWLEDVSSQGVATWKVFSRPTVRGEAKIANYETGIEVSPRQGFIKTLICKESAITAGGLALACIAYVIRNANSPITLDYFIPVFLVGTLLTFLLTISCALLRHFLVLPRFTWVVPQLKD